MRAYLDLLGDVLSTGLAKRDRTGTGTLSTFGRQVRFDLSKTVPILTTKKIHLKSVIYELLWFLSGSTDVKYLQDNGVTIWDEWAEGGDLGCIYGAQWRHWGKRSGGNGIDQMKKLMGGLKHDPFSRRHIVSSWNVTELDGMSLPPCHCLFQLYVSSDHGLSLHLYQRSADLFLGVPFNITSYGLLVHMIGHVLGYKPRELVISYGDLHLYSNHLDQAREQLAREPHPQSHTLALNERVKDLFQFGYEDIKIQNYSPEPAIPAPIAV